MWEYYFCKFAADPLKLRQSTTTSPTMNTASRNRVRRNICARARRGGNLPRTVFTVIPFGIILLQRGKLQALTAIRKGKTPPTGKSEGLESKGKKKKGKRTRWKNRWVTRRNPKVVLARILVSSLVKRKVVEEEGGGLREVETGGLPNGKRKKELSLGV